MSSYYQDYREPLILVMNGRAGTNMHRDYCGRSWTVPGGGFTRDIVAVQLSAGPVMTFPCVVDFWGASLADLSNH
jgi:hypothetical protein